MGDADGTGVLRCAQDDSKNLQRRTLQQQNLATVGPCNSKNLQQWGLQQWDLQRQKQIHFGDNHQRSIGNGNRQKAEGSPLRERGEWGG